MFDGLMAATYVALWLIVIVQTLVLFEMLRQIGILRRRMPPEPGALLTGDGLERGALAPSFSGLDARSGEQITDAKYRGRKTLLVFLSPRCAGCHILAPDLQQFARDYIKEIQVVAICPGMSAECASYARTYTLDIPIIVDPDQRISEEYRVHQTPGATLVDPNGRVLLHAIPNNLSHLEGILQEEGTPMLNPPRLVQDEQEVAPIAGT